MSRAEGAAGIIGRGPILRLVAYGCALAALALFRRSTLCKFAAIAAWVTHVGPQQRRVWRSRAGSPDGLPARVLATLAVVLGADAAWIAGYPLACWRAGTGRRTRRNGTGTIPACRPAPPQRH